VPAGYALAACIAGGNTHGRADYATRARRFSRRSTLQGRIIMLMTQGKEEALFKRSQGVVKSVQKVTAAKNFAFYPHNPRMVPDQFKPELLKVRRHGGHAMAPTRTGLLNGLG